MGAYYDEVEIEDMVWDVSRRVYHYPCPCGDRFEISRQQLRDCEDIATCPSCSLIIRVIYDPVSTIDCFLFRCCAHCDVQLDFEDGSEDEEEEQEETDSDSSDEKFEDAMENLTL